MAYPSTHNLHTIKSELATGRAVVTFVADSYGRPGSDRVTSQMMAGMTLPAPPTGFWHAPNGDGVVNRSDATSWSQVGGTNAPAGLYAYNNYLHANGEYFGLPLNSVFYSAFVAGETQAIRVQTKQRSWMPTARFWWLPVGSTSKARFCYWHPADSATVDEYDHAFYDRYSGNATYLRGTFNFGTDARKFLSQGETPDGSNRAGGPLPGINAFPVDMERSAHNVVETIMFDVVRQDATVTASRYRNAAGIMLYEVDGSGDYVPGTVFRMLQDNSWGSPSYAQNAASNVTTPKQYLTSQLVQWDDVTTLDTSQRDIIVVHLDNEAGTYAAQLAGFTAMVSEWEYSATQNGKLQPRVLFVHSHVREIDAGDTAANLVANQVTGQAMYDAALATGSSFLSLAALTGNTRFYNATEADAWLAANMPTITWGTLAAETTTGVARVDTGGHCDNAQMAAVFAKIIDEAIQAYSPAVAHSAEPLGLETSLSL